MAGTQKKRNGNAEGNNKILKMFQQTFSFVHESSINQIILESRPALPSVTASEAGKFQMIK